MKKAFTLIELLAVIIILAVIALIATPIVLDVVESAKKSSFESSAYGMVDAMKLESMESMIEGNSMAKEYNFSVDKLDIQGDQLNGTGSVDEDGRIAIAVYNGKWCATKGFTDGTITVTEYVEGECTLPVEGGDDVVVLEGDPIREKIAALVLDENGDCKDDETTYEYMGGCYIKAEPSTTLANHVWYNGFLWRIMGINNLGTENESIRMITEENVTSIPYDDDSSNFDGSHADSWLNDYFYNKLSNENNLKDIIVEGTFCQGAATTTAPSNETCTGDSLEKNVGLLSIDEYVLADGISSYLYSGQVFWTMSPYNSSNAWYVNYNGFTSNGHVSNALGLRPVINVNSNSTITGGNGTLSKFYVLGEYKNESSTIENLSSAKIGEYVSLNDKTYRVVENGTTTKLILDSYYQETSGTNYTMKYGSDNLFTTSNRNTEDATLSGIGYILNTTVLNWLTANENDELQTKYKNAIVTGNWYQNGFTSGDSYTVSLNEESTPIEAQVGLIRVGEMLSGQSYSILTKNGEVVSSSSNAAPYWTMTPATSSSNAWNVYSSGIAGSSSVSSTSGLRPVINVNSNSTISSGNGTLNSPFAIEVK